MGWFFAWPSIGLACKSAISFLISDFDFFCITFLPRQCTARPLSHKTRLGPLCVRSFERPGGQHVLQRLVGAVSQFVFGLHEGVDLVGAFVDHRASGVAEVALY